MNRGEVWWGNMPSPVGRRPVILLSRSAAYRVRSQIIVAPVTTRIRGIRSEVGLGPSDGLPQVCVANLDVIVTINKSSLDSLLAVLSREKMTEVEEAIRYALGMG